MLSFNGKRQLLINLTEFVNTLTFFFLQLLCLTMRHLHQPNHFFFFNIHESSLFITRSISSYIIAYHYQYVKHSSQQFMHVLLILRCINGMDKHKKLSKHFENILFVIGCVVIKIVKLIACSNYISLSN